MKFRLSLARRAGTRTMALFVAVTLLASADAGAGLLEDYVAAADTSFTWSLTAKAEVPAEPTYTRYTIEMTSQTWRGNAWTHNVLVFVPEEVEHPETVMLVIGGGRNREENGSPQGASSPEAFVLPPIATRGRALVALLSQVPNQPILGGLNEDQAIAHSFSQFLATGEQDWPLLLPMTKSAVRAMDAIQAFAKQELGVEVRSFMVSGASKRGWTTWLTAAVDRRVTAIAPMVIDNLNIEKQMPHQLETWGSYSASIADYTKLNLQAELGNASDRGRVLLEAIDPYFYRDRLGMPKLIQNGTNDPYWVLDASQFYFPDLDGEKYLHFSPNTPHSIDLEGIMSIAGFFHFVRTNQDRPRFDWQVSSLVDGEVLTITHNDPPVKVRVWMADSATKDFRQAVWASKELQHAESNQFRAVVNLPATGYRAYYAEMVYGVEPGVTMGLCTEMRVIAATAE